MKLQVGGLQRDGRPRGYYVYLLLCQIDGLIHVKVGRSDDPVERLNELLVGCPVEPGILAVCSLPTSKMAWRAEAELHCVLEPWHTHGEWFSFKPEDRSAFNLAWRAALLHFASPSWPMKWTKLSVRPLLAYGRSRLGFFRARRRRAGRAFQDFQRDKGPSRP
jgi:hypothetical protein